MTLTTEEVEQQRRQDAILREAQAKYGVSPEDDSAKRTLAQVEAREGKTASEANAESEEADSLTDRETAARIASSADLFHSADGRAFASIDLNGHTETVPVRSRRFKSWLVLRFRELRGKAPSTDALSIAQTEAEARAELEGEEHEVFVRMGHQHGRIYLDLCDDQWRAVEIDRTGWRILTRLPVRFHRPKDALALPEPVEGGSLDALRPFVNAPDDDDWRMIVAWLVGSMAPQGPYPVLALYGEQGSAKSTTTRRLRSVADDARTITAETPSNTRDLAIAANRRRVLAYDNLSWLDAQMSDALCRLATGGGFSTRSLYTDDEESTFYATRPVIVNGIEEFATRGDLLSRSIVLFLPRLDQLRDERTLDAEWTKAHPAILGGLLDAVSCALRRWPEVELSRAPRMADFARWVEAAAPALGWAQGDFLRLYEDNRDDAVEAEIDASPFARALLAFAETIGHYEGTAGELLDKINSTADYENRGKHWPSSAKAASDRVTRHATALRKSGVSVERRKTNGRKLIVLDAGDPGEPGDALPIS